MTTEPSKSTCQARESKTHFFTSSGALTPSLRSVARPPLLVKTWTKNTRSTPTFCCTRSFAALTRSLAKSESKASAFPREELRSSVLSFAPDGRSRELRSVVGPLAHSVRSRYNRWCSPPPHRNRTTPSPTDSLARFVHSVIHRQSFALTSLRSLLMARFARRSQRGATNGSASLRSRRPHTMSRADGAAAARATAQRTTWLTPRLPSKIAR